MVKAAVTRKQVEDESVRLAVNGQIKFVELVADALRDDVLGFHLGCDYGELRRWTSFGVRPLI